MNNYEQGYSDGCARRQTTIDILTAEVEDEKARHNKTAEASGKLFARVSKLKAALEAHHGKCKWKWDDMDDCWETSCGDAYCIMEGTPSDNKMKFCPYCGKALKETGGQ